MFAVFRWLCCVEGARSSTALLLYGREEVTLHTETRSPVDSPLEAAAGGAGPHVTTAFKLLSSEIRLSILLALWESYDPYGPNTGMSFSELYGRVGASDSANFTYHLNQLIDHFVEKTDDGYELRNAGLMIVQALIASC